MSDWPFGDLRESSYGLILADPPWRFVTHSERGQTKAAPYARMSRFDLLTLPVWRLAAPNCALAMWATQAQLPQAIETMKRWGFDYKTAGAWAKQSKTGAAWAFGTGYWLRSTAEFFLLGAYGRPDIRSRSERNLIVAPVREHSRKPEALHEALERMFPAVRKLEMFAREQREGWDSWGDEIDTCGALDA
jgi:N6-adenosine-specific RNA methylase IME4